MDNVLLALDDEQPFLDIIRRVAKSADFTAVTTTDPAVFKAALLTSPPTVILLDLQMPDCDGVEILHVLAESQSRAKVILLSGFETRVLGLARGIGQGLGLDMGEPMPKPLRPADLQQVLASLKRSTINITAVGLKEALDNDYLDLFYQPIVALDTDETIGFEGLVRWKHPEYGIVPPDLFIGLAEREDLIERVTDRVLEVAAKQISSWRTQGIDTFVSVNLSAHNIVADLPDRLVRLCTRHNILPEYLRLELTETAAMANHALMLEILTRVRLKGFMLAIDDFGTGYSSLVQLHRLPFSELKIDQSFVREMSTSAEANLIVGTIINLGRSMEMDLIAEGIETADQKERLAEMGCGTGQGYLFSKPMPASDVPAWLEKRELRAGA